MRKARQKKIDAEDEILMMGYLLMKRKMRKRRNQQQKQWVREIFLPRGSHRAVARTETTRQRIIFQVIFIVMSYFAALCYIYAEKCSQEIFLKYKCKAHVNKIEGLITV